MFAITRQRLCVALKNRPARSRRIGRPLLLFLTFTATSILPARDWHVSATGNDTADGTTPATALRSLKKAADLVAPGDTVLIGDGTYTPPTASSRAAAPTTPTTGSP